MTIEFEIKQRYSYRDFEPSPLQVQLIQTLKEKGEPLMRKDLAKLLKTPRTTIYDNLLKLQKRKIVEKFTKNNGLRGRPKVMWCYIAFGEELEEND